MIDDLVHGIPGHYSDAVDRARAYVLQNNLRVTEQLGWGQDGIVFSTLAQSAIKTFLYSKQYEAERNAYIRFLELDLSNLSGFSIPRLIRYDDTLLVVEMEIVRPPFVLDFAGAYLDQPPPYAGDRKIMAAWEKRKKFEFGDRWPIVRGLLAEFRRHGVHLSDVKPGNICFDLGTN